MSNFGSGRYHAGRKTGLIAARRAGFLAKIGRGRNRRNIRKRGRERGRDQPRLHSFRWRWTRNRLEREQVPNRRIAVRQVHLGRIDDRLARLVSARDLDRLRAVMGLLSASSA